ncbi:holo-ACP synthase [Uliginosibacterium sp. 31-16]|uniref:holo-ACP synthase n=1 Tax=Uliginosibacterium sp. 31-16 TaxID=3068315 RepID=UPI00273E217C|nr:holo-ACP synthase [Uliginosibacterium sp. 31-16]MDP5240847.1 holo-ACP synthase [Uliginosibacterium sp. 31-16]
MIYGIGTDIVTVARMREALARHGERFAERLLHPDELDAYRKTREPERFLAKRFAAKEAFAKALGTGLRPPATLSAIGVSHDALGKPLYIFSDALADHLLGLGLNAHLSISDEREHVIAFAILEKHS